MASLFIKGTALVTNHMFFKGKECLGLYLLCIMNPWERINFGQTGELLSEHPPEVRKRYGEVRSALDAFQNDIHNLSIGYHQMKRVMSSKMEYGLKKLYLGNLVENYVTNIKCIYDQMAVFSRIVLDQTHLKAGKGCQESLNKLLNSIKKNTTHFETAFGKRITKVLLAMEFDLEAVKSIRDSIIHDGKEPIITFPTGQPHIEIIRSNFKKDMNLLPDLLNLGNVPYPMFAYLQHLTREMIGHIDSLGLALSEHFQKNDPNYPLELVGLIGICIKDFVNFIIRDIKPPAIIPQDNQSATS